ncbi:dihydroorotase [Marinomonas dokdonensis]|uniref:dihydroorotase n=1 Tax=Marinomonas dokdonensis TaxID=328224 RepID=UPI0040554942
MKLRIRNGRLMDPSQGLDTQADLFIDNQKIVAIGEAPADFDDAQEVDASGLWVLPGLVDLAVSLREPGFSQKGSIASEGRAAVAGGVTTLICPPDTKPIVDTPSVAALIQDKADEAGMANVFPLGALTQGLDGAHLSNMVSLTDAGCIALSNHRHPMASSKILTRALEYAASNDLLVVFHSDEASLSEGGCAHEGLMSTAHGLAGIPETAETIALMRDLLLIEKTGVRAHFARISCAKSVEMIANARAAGLDVTADVAIHNLLLTDSVLNQFDGHYHVIPPLRSEADRLALIEGVKNGVISAICSDHQPHEKMAKVAPFAATAPGMANVEVLLPLALQLVEQGLDHATILSRVTAGPASCFGLEAGSLAVGSFADFVLYKEDEQWQWTPEHRKTKGHNSPYMGESFTGKVLATYVSGQCVFANR